MIEYVNDYKHNYLTEICEDEDDFSLRMLMENDIPGLLRPEIRHMDGETKLYYCISGKQNLSNLFVNKNIGKKDFFSLLHSIYQLTGLAEEFFFSCGGIVLTPEMIFWNMENNLFEFIYIPSGDEGMNLAEIADFIVSKVAYDDEQFSDLVYQFCEDVYENRMNLEKYIEEEKHFSENEEVQEREPERKEPREEVSEQDDSGPIEDDLEFGYYDREEVSKERKVKKKHEKKSEKKGEKKSERKVVKRKSENSFLSALMDLVFGRNEKLEYPDNIEDFWSNDESDMEFRYGERDCVSEPEERYEKEDTQTVFYDVASVRENKLYHIGKKHAPNIELSHLPCVIGKDEEMVDYCISDVTVSRMHVRFFEEDGACWMQDMNSTNGTFHNGLRLRPNQKVLLQKEDEVGIGQMNYIYR